ncbi:phage tail protein [Pendulispora brunnea]|uniref:Phage tail protein n=1 Tax=Pendulispora brunnea TaxID=2905690 RepID=A0ABZ2KL95_9BACT
MAIARNNPYGVFNFKVEFGNGVTGAFSEITGLDSEQGIIEYRTGDEEVAMRKLSGIRKHPNVVMKRGIVGTDGFWKWRKQVENGQVEDANVRTLVTVHLLNEKRETVVTWKIKNAWPCKLSGPSLAAGKNETALESLELAHEGVDLE